MTGIPQELVDHISRYLSVEDLKRTLSLNHQFQCAAERFSGAYEEFELTEASALALLELYADRRLRYLCHVIFKTSLPRHGKSEKEWLAILRGPD